MSQTMDCVGQSLPSKPVDLMQFLKTGNTNEDIFESLFTPDNFTTQSYYCSASINSPNINVYNSSTSLNTSTNSQNFFDEHYSTVNSDILFKTENCTNENINDFNMGISNDLKLFSQTYDTNQSQKHSNVDLCNFLDDFTCGLDSENRLQTVNHRLYDISSPYDNEPLNSGLKNFIEPEQLVENVENSSSTSSELNCKSPDHQVAKLGKDFENLTANIQNRQISANLSLIDVSVNYKPTQHYHNISVKNNRNPDAVSKGSAESLGGNITSQRSPNKRKRGRRCKIGFTEPGEPTIRQQKKKSGRWLGEKAISILERWYAQHRDHPYPTESERKELTEQTQLANNRLIAWFSNKRNRDNNTMPKKRMKFQQTYMNELVDALDLEVSQLNEELIRIIVEDSQRVQSKVRIANISGIVQKIRAQIEKDRLEFEKKSTTNQ